MAESVGFAEAFAGALAEVAPVLDERARRLLLGAGARQSGRGGIKLIAAATGAAADTVRKGAAELESGIVADGRVRAHGAGRKPAEQTDPGLWPALDRLVDPETRGDPMSRLRWTTRSTVKLADELTAQGHRVGPNTVARLLKVHDYSLQGNAKTIEGKQHPDRDAQFRYLNDQVTAFLAAGLPVISVDTKKKENVGAYKNGGREYQPQGEPVSTNTYDFIGEGGKAVPYGVYDVGTNTGWVNVGTDADTGMFAVESIRRWWTTIGALAYPGADRLLITADGGGSNGSRLRLWKTQLAPLAAQTGLQITVCHLPPGTSKWNKIEHRMFSAITMNWRGRPLETHEVVVETIAATTTKTGLTIQAALDTNTYPRGIKITDKEMRTFETTHLQRHTFHGDWNYTVTATPDADTTHPNQQTQHTQTRGSNFCVSTYLHALDPAHEVPAAELLPQRPRRASPYLYSDDDIVALITAIHSLRTALRRTTLATVIGLLAVTGIRVGEVIALDRGDVDLASALLVVRHGKFGQARELALHPTTVEALRRYQRLRDQLAPVTATSAFFVSTAGTRLHYCNVHNAFHRLVGLAGLTPRSASCRPRIHDLRHSFAVRAMLDAYATGQDGQARLTLLSTWLGHVHPASTYWYLSASPELMALAGQRLEAHLAGRSAGRP